MDTKLPMVVGLVHDPDGRVVLRAPYVPPFNGPVYWGDDQGGEFKGAIIAYMHAMAEGEEDNLLDRHFALTRAYVEYYVNAPCWTNATGTGDIVDKLDLIRNQIIVAKKPEDIDQVIELCLGIGLDPL